MNFKLKNNNKKIGKTPCEQTIFSTMYLRVYAQLLGIYPEETKIEKDTCTPMFIEALYTITRIWKQPRCPLTDE